MAWRYCYKDVLPFSAMVAAESTSVGLNTLFKAATLKGLSYYVFILYSYAIATLLLLPLALIFRRPGLPTFKLSLLYRILLLGVLGYENITQNLILGFEDDIYNWKTRKIYIFLMSIFHVFGRASRFSGQLCGYKGIEYSSPTLASAMSNLTPAFTFILAVILRMENLALRSSITQAKIIGTIVSISGALVVVFYKGPTIIPAASQSPSISLHFPLGSSQTNWIIGGLLLAAEYLLVSIWYILQTQVMKIYPSELTVVFLYKLCATILSAPVCLIAEGNLSDWRIKPDIALTAIIFSGLFGLPFTSVVRTWGLHLKGPVYVSTFKPLSIVIAAAMGVIFLGDALCLGSVIGAIILSIGFYAVLWAKTKEELSNGRLGSSSDDKTPLLDSYKVEGI